MAFNDTIDGAYRDILQSRGCLVSSYTFYAALLPRRGRILRRTLSVRLYVRPSRYRASRRAT